MEIYEYKGRYFFSLEDLDEYIMDNHDDPVNNTDPCDYLDFESIHDHEVETIEYEKLSNDDKWDVFKAWCKDERKPVSHASSVIEFHKLLEG
jgi:hypothetical protein